MRRSWPITFILDLLTPLLTIAIWLVRPTLLQASFHDTLIGWGLDVAPLFISGAIIALAGQHGPSRARDAVPAAILALLVAARLIQGNSVVAALMAFPFALQVISVGLSSRLHSPLLDCVGNLSYGIIRRPVRSNSSPSSWWVVGPGATSCLRRR